MESGQAANAGKPQNSGGPQAGKPKGPPGAQQPGGPAVATVQVLPAAGPARRRARHYGVLFSFVLCVMLPAGAVFGYLYAIAADQYASTAGFSVRKEEVNSTVDILGGLTQLSGSSSTDTDILYEFIQSQEMVAKVNARLDLKTIYSKPEFDPVFTINRTSTIEDLVDYWGRVVKIYYDASTGLIEFRVLAFEPTDARNIAEAVFAESSAMINELSAIAREDAMRYATTELETAVERLKQAREALTTFRSRTQIVDPSADIQGQMGLLSMLQQQLAESLIEFDLLHDTTRDNDPRIEQAQRRITVIEARIAEERKKFGFGGQGPGESDYATLISEFERLSVDRVFAESAYTLALTTLDSARAEARRQSRYLAAYIKPTLAQKAEYPQRLIFGGLALIFLLLGWSIGVLIYYSLRDRR